MNVKTANVKTEQMKQFLTEQKKKDHVDGFIKTLKDKSRIEVLV